MLRFRSTMRCEIGNLVTHSVGLGLAITGTAFLIAKSIDFPVRFRLASYIIYGACIIFLYLDSSIYHAECLNRLDAAIRDD
jgi:hemolysin III